MSETTVNREDERSLSCRKILGSQKIYCTKPLRRRGACGYRTGDMALRSAWRTRSGAALFLQFLYPVLLIIDNRCGMRIGARHAHMRQRHDQCLAFSFGDDVAYAPALVSRIRQI